MVLYSCVLIVFSLCRESLKLILVNEPPPPPLRWFYNSIDILFVNHLVVFIFIEL
jgi:hypothetical protein